MAGRRQWPAISPTVFHLRETLEAKIRACQRRQNAHTKAMPPDFAQLYAHYQTVAPSEIFTWPAQAHGMGDSLDAYVRNHLPAAELEALASHLRQIQVLGVYPAHAQAVLPSGRFAVLPFVAKPPRNHNWARPEFFLSFDRQVLAVCVPPGRDYLKHYTSLLRYFLDRFLPGRGIDLEARFYPGAALTLAHWTGLDELALPPGSTVLLGHIDEFLKAVDSPRAPVALCPIRLNAYFDLCRLDLPRRRSSKECLYVLGFSFSYWGEMAGSVGRALYEAGANELIYLSKVGSLDPALDLYGDLIIPERFMLAEHDRVLRPPFGVSNGLLDWARATGQVAAAGSLHLSTPTVLEQSHLQRQVLAPFAPRTVDDEITHLAAAAERAGGSARFSSLCFATDYVRDAADAGLPVVFDLSNNRSPAARARRDEALARAARLLDGYLTQR